MSLRKDLDKYIPRKEQLDCIEFIDKMYKEDKERRTFLLNLPVGSGKSHLSLMISDWYIKNVNGAAKIDVITNSKILQNQYTDTYSSINDMKGKDNYTCSQYDCSCASGLEFNKLNKTTCEYCPYVDARNGFISGKISLTNFYLYILYSLYIPDVIKNRAPSVLIVDECHELEEIMSDFISIKITETVIKRYKFSNESGINKKLKAVRDIEGYLEFLNFLSDEISSTIDQLSNHMSSQPRTPKADMRENKISKMVGDKNPDVSRMQMIADLTQFLSKIDIFKEEYKNDPDNWVLERKLNDKTKQWELSLEPIWSYDYLDKYIFSKYDMVFMMSGTILDKELFCYLNGLDSQKTVYYEIESPFPIKNRPIYYLPVGKMSYTKKEETFKRYVVYIQKILNKYSDKKGIIHTNSFELSSWISRDVKNERLTFHDSSNKEEVLKEHIESQNPLVLVSPSMDTGVSFDNDLARFQVIAKVPFPSLGSQKNKLRQKNNPRWYDWKTVSSLCQMTGRVVRSNKDHADTIIIDSNFGDLLRYSSDLFPNWVLESIKKIEVK